ncbi:hypothetical protein PPL_11638 [Heterostelium album PN500]|uniref:Uncharacterized protein n=1 Tax=Heterostelium pallidum (strain ATCC 26659 / Pp 5 / PN500) TaxID=670386 RepID=D3BVB2_HETP5|nr:hypothetical protein PPL_11638 [Heterostelium album PN500]EFA74669.1 hypothetical protein PPL_11638 [Heterostelium album PN500]|eukprot:XP_020426803.1 hypothetical protein PPL_11638 [Heterostelium album PN500]
MICCRTIMESDDNITCLYFLDLEVHELVDRLDNETNNRYHKLNRAIGQLSASVMSIKSTLIGTSTRACEEVSSMFVQPVLPIRNQEQSQVLRALNVEVEELLTSKILIETYLLLFVQVYSQSSPSKHEAIVWCSVFCDKSWLTNVKKSLF